MGLQKIFDVIEDFKMNNFHADFNTMPNDHDNDIKTISIYFCSQFLKMNWILTGMQYLVCFISNYEEVLWYISSECTSDTGFCDKNMPMTLSLPITYPDINLYFDRIIIALW